jgi:transcriptional regulator with XRE-family HTH domain
MPYQRTARAHRGVITGYVFKLIRESIPRSQEHLAADLGVDRGTVQGWESGRRPFTSVAYGQTVAIRTQLARTGAHPELLAVLDDAAEADYLLDQILDVEPEIADVGRHALAGSVLTHSLTEMLTWVTTDQEPTFIKLFGPRSGRRGPVAPRPLLEAGEREAFFANLQALADYADRRDPAQVLLHRQACFLAGMDPSGETTNWLSGRTRAAISFTGFHTWSPLWPDARSVATSLAKQGDPELLRDFIARAHPDDACELAGLNYWAYWVGELRHRQHDDTFMINKGLAWRGGRLLRHLTERLHAGHAFVDLNIHTLWSLLTVRRDLPHDDSAVGRDLLVRGERLLDEGEISDQSRRELTSVLYGLRIGGFTSDRVGR